jgi:hypothetical protein
MVYLTFYDGLPCQYKTVVPELNRSKPERDEGEPSSSRSFRTTERTTTCSMFGSATRSGGKRSVRDTRSVVTVFDIPA